MSARAGGAGSPPRSAHTPQGDLSNRTVAEVGYWSGLTACASAVAFVVVQSMQLLGWLRFPADEILVYGTSLCIVVPFLLEILALHHLTPRRRQFWTHAAIAFAIIYAVFVTANYVVQLVTVIPAKRAGDLGDLRVLDQTPHSMFWDFDAIGYVAMGLVALVAVPAIDHVGFERWVRRSLVLHALVTPLIGIVYFAPAYSTTLLQIGFPWAITAPLFMLMIAIMVRRRRGSLSPDGLHPRTRRPHGPRLGPRGRRTAPVP